MFKKTYIIQLLFLSFFFSNTINYNSIEYSIYSYWKLMPNLSRPFDSKNLFYANLTSSYSDSLLSIKHAYRKNKKVKSTKKLKSKQNP